MSFRKNRRKQTGEDMPGKISYAQGDEPRQDQAQQAPAQGQTEQADQPQQEESATADDVPDGTTAEILAWVNGDKARAQAALEKESADDKPRSGLTRYLNEIINKP